MCHCRILNYLMAIYEKLYYQTVSGNLTNNVAEQPMRFNFLNLKQHFLTVCLEKSSLPIRFLSLLINIQ